MSLSRPTLSKAAVIAIVEDLIRRGARADDGMHSSDFGRPDLFIALVQAGTA